MIGGAFIAARFRAVLLSPLLLLLVAGAALGAAAKWEIADAPYRFKLYLASKPTHPSAGYFVHLPDAGLLLRGAAPATVVTTEDGKVIPSYILWYNQDSGIWLAFADPGGSAQSVYVYVQGTISQNLWKPDCGLTPSAILCTLPYRDSLPGAQALGTPGRVEPSVHAQLHYGVKRAPLSIGGDLTGRPRPGSFYLLSYVDAPIAGSYWISPYSFDGKCEVLIDGKKIDAMEHTFPGSGKGVSMVLTKGLHRLEVFQTAGGTGDYYQEGRYKWGLLFLTWRQPNEKFKEIHSRAIEDSAVVRSGECKIAGIESKNGAPVAMAVANPGPCFWFQDEEPLIIYDFHAITGGQPPDATYTWTLSKGCDVQGPELKWIFPGFRENSVKLTVKSAKGTSAFTLPFYGFSTQKTSLENAADREAFRVVLASMLKAYPRDSHPDPVEEWSPVFWNGILRTVEGGEGYPLLLQLFTDHFEDARKKLSPDQLYALEDIFLDLIQHNNPAEALAWIKKFQTIGTSFTRTNDLKLREGEMQMFIFDDRKKAGQLFASVSGSGDSAERAKVRLGDLAFLEGDLNKATAYYADVQRRARLKRNASSLVPGSLVSNDLVEAGNAQASPSPSSPFTPPPSGPKMAPGADLKHGALQEVSLSENVRTLTEDGYFLEARETLMAWELQFPLSKVSGDYIMREAALYMKLGEWKRARAMIEAYCRQVDASSFLPEATSMLISCVKGMNEPLSPSMVEIVEKVKGRLKYHPIASELDRFLSEAKKTPTP